MEYVVRDADYTLNLARSVLKKNETVIRLFMKHAANHLAF